MSLNFKRLCALGHKAPFLLVVLAAALMTGGSLFYVAAQRNSLAPAVKTTLPELNHTSVPATSVFFQRLYCASDDGRRNYCNADTRDGVRLVRQRSGSPCIQGRTWDYDRRGIWVDRGCRADFELGDRRSDRDYDRDRDRDRDYNRDRNRGDVQTFYCESGDGKRHWCHEGLYGQVRLIRQRSGSPCIQGRTWGRDRSGVWVDRGCRADFEVRR